jgi:hypothetical protein
VRFRERATIEYEYLLREVAFGKMKAMVEGARILRAELKS